MSEYYFNKGFVIFECDEVNLKRLPFQVKDRFGAEVSVDSDLVHAMLYHHSFHFKYTGAGPVLSRTLVDIRPSFIGARLKN